MVVGEAFDEDLYAYMVDKETITEAIEKVKKYVSICQEVESLLIGGLLA